MAEKKKEKTKEKIANLEQSLIQYLLTKKDSNYFIKKYQQMCYLHSKNSN